MACPPNTVSYTIKRGDTLYMLARQYDTTVAAILSANPDVDPQRLMPGQVICIPQQQVYPPCPEGNYYTIKAGDTLYKIARQYNVSLDDLLEANPAIDPFALKVGQVICIPLATPPVTCPEGYTQYTVKAGDTYTTIARQYGITVEALGAANPSIDPTRLLIGQILCIPPVSTETCPEGYTQYTVKAGDTFYKLARQYGVTVDAIRAANPGVDPNRLTIGQKLCIPPAAPMTCPEGYTQHTVKAGDSFYKLAAQYGVSVDAIRTANPGVDPNRLTIGQMLCIPPAAPMTCPEGYTQHTVKAGDSFYKLAAQYGVSVDAIRAANPGVDPNRLTIGQMLCIPPAAPAGTCPEGYTQHTVKAGDSFYKLARQYGVAVEVIQAANPGVDSTRLTIGQKLCIPPAGTCPQGYTQYTVKAGDTLYKLAQQYGVTVDALMAANPGVDPRSLQIGSKLCVPAAT